MVSVHHHPLQPRARLERITLLLTRGLPWSQAVSASQQLKVMISGAPAAGKGTQCANIVDKVRHRHQCAQQQQESRLLQPVIQICTAVVPLHEAPQHPDVPH